MSLLSSFDNSNKSNDILVPPNRIKPDLTLSLTQFEEIKRLMLKVSGVVLPKERQSLVVSRLKDRLQQTQSLNFSEYLVLVNSNTAERDFFVDALTTHETYFFRERAHFDHMISHARDKQLMNAKIWSAACSMGHEAYTAALMMADIFPSGRWQVTGTDIALDTIRKAKSATYSVIEKRKILNNLYNLYCLEDGQNKTFTLKESVTSKVDFQQFNLLSQRSCKQYDFIFLRNVLIYFSSSDQRKIINNVLSALKPDGVIYFGHSEQALAREMGLERVNIGAYKKPSNKPETNNYFPWKSTNSTANQPVLTR